MSMPRKKASLKASEFAQGTAKLVMCVLLNIASKDAAVNVVACLKLLKVFAFQQSWSPFNNAEVSNVTH